MLDNKPFVLRMPVALLLQDAHNLYLSVQDHRITLEKFLLDWTKVESVPVLADQCARAEAAWKRYCSDYKKETAELNAFIETCLLLRSDLLETARFVLSDKNYGMNISQYISAITADRSISMVTQSMNDVAILVRTHYEALSKYGVTLEQADQAASMSEELGVRFARHNINSPKTCSIPCKTERNRLCEELVGVIGEIRAVGMFVFRRNPEIRALFVDHYRARKYRERKHRVSDESSAVQSASA